MTHLYVTYKYLYSTIFLNENGQTEKYLNKRINKMEKYRPPVMKYV